VLRGWWPYYRTSVRLGARALRRGERDREAVIRVVAPMDDSRFYELPETVNALQARPGDRVLDLASPKLAAVQLAKHGAHVTSVDAYAPEIEIWNRLTSDIPNVDLHVGDGRALNFEDGSFDHAYTISVVEHIPRDGDLPALAELARVVKPGGRVVVTVPYAAQYGEDWRDEPMYDPEDSVEQDGRWFFSRIYDEQRLDRLVEHSGLTQQERRIVNFKKTAPYRLYQRAMPASLVLGPLLVGAGTSVTHEPGGFAMLVLTKP
jgi:SAM-dependent methyltransferase